MVGICSLSNLRKTWYFFKKNGFRNACLTVMERLEERKGPGYRYEAPDRRTLRAQREQGAAAKEPVRFSVLVPAYETKASHLRALLDSVSAQSWPHWELVLADASRNETVLETLREWALEKGVRILREKEEEGFVPGAVRYRKLEENGGISANTNAGLVDAKGDYTGLLDHDDLLAPDALYEMAQAVEREKETGREALALYSDEDKCDGTGAVFYEPHRKTDFDPELLLTNNYICHFLVVQTRLLQRLGLRPAFDGAQDYDLVLRASGEGVPFLHVGKVLYHWRCHEDSTAQNPRSKSYAYEAGRRALEDFCRRKGWRARVSHLKHLGFYRLDYEALWQDRPEIGAVAFPRRAGGRLVSGIYEEDQAGVMRYDGLKAGFSGPMRRAALQQQAGAAALDQLMVRPGLEEEYQKALQRAGAAGQEKAAREFGRFLKRQGMRILWDPQKERYGKNDGNHSEL